MAMNTANVPSLLLAAALGAAVSWLAARGLPGGDAGRMTALEANQQAMLKELQALKASGPAPQQPAAQGQNAAPPPPPALPADPLTIAGAASMGRADAPLTLIEFSDFQCPFCSRHVRETFDKIRTAYVDTGKVRYVFRNYPIESLHPQAWASARTAECAGRQGKFWELHQRLFANQKQLSDADLQTYARAAGVDMKALNLCIADPAVTAKISKDLDEGSRAGVSGTPIFFVGRIENGKVKALRRLNGAVPFAAFQQTFDALLASPTASSN
jgi:protein-disulfide isomerase